MDDGAVSYSGYYKVAESWFYDFAPIYEDPYYEGGNLIAIATEKSTLGADSIARKFNIWKIDIND